MGRLKLQKQKYRVQECAAAYLMLLPNILGILVFLFIPILYSAYISLHDWDALSTMKWIGLDNYVALFKDKFFGRSLVITFEYAVMYVPAVVIISLLLALLVESVHGKVQQVYRSLLFFPYTISTVVASFVFMFIFDTKGGYLNNFLMALGFSKQPFLSTPQQALGCVAAVGVWLACGYNMVLFLAALKDVPKSYYEAADIDGANAWQKFWKITLPAIKNTTVFILVVTTIASFQVFNQIKIMTSGGPGNRTLVAVYYIYKKAFEQYHFGYASAIAVVLAFIIIILTSIQLKLTSGKEEKA